MLVLLVIFMVTAPLVTPAVIDLPTVDKASAPKVVPIEVFVKADQQLVVRQRDAAGAIVVERTVSRGELGAFIKSVRGKGDPAVLIGGDKNARYEAVLGVMDELHRQGIQKVGCRSRRADAWRPKPSLFRCGASRRCCARSCSRR
jgi:biopolymer transport protein TolR